MQKPRVSRRAEIIGWGMYAPELVMTNDDWAARLDTSDEWIRTRTGIERRHVANGHETSAQMSIEASRAALQMADADPRLIDLIIVGTATPDYPMPSTACQVQNALGAIHAGAFDLNAGCSGFVYGLVMGHQAIASGEHELVLVVGVDSLTKSIDWEDRNTCILFGDGAGAVLLRATEGPTGVLATLLGSDGSGAEFLQIPAGGSARPACHTTVEDGQHYLRMDGRQVFRFAARAMPDAIRRVTRKAGLALDDVSLIVPHQANMRIIDAAAKRLKLPAERFAVNLQEYGNTSAGSVPIAMCEALEQGRIKPGENIVFVAFGAGLTWAAAAVKWGPAAEHPPARFYRTWWRWLIYRSASLRHVLRLFGQSATVRFIRHAETNDKGDGAASAPPGEDS